MKKLTYLFLLLIFVSCSKQEAIVGVWRLEKMNIDKAIAGFKGEQKEFARFMISKTFELVKGKMKMTFNEDKKFTIETPLINGQTEKQSGEWKISANRKKLTIKSNGETEVHQILRLTESELRLEMEQAGLGKMEMTFVKE